MILSHQKYIYATLAYADIFDYPLTPEELHRWMIGTRRARLPRMHRKYLTLPGRIHIVLNRIERDFIAQKKWEIVRRTTLIFSWIPTLCLIGVTGGLAMNNAKESDDIDIFFITKQNSLWITRFMVTVIADVFGKRRRPYERMVQNKICLNMFMAEDALSLPVSDRDLFAAHEVLQMVPIWEKGNTYQKFLSANEWVKDYLPNAWAAKVQSKQKVVDSKNANFLFIFLEPFARMLQLLYMRKHRTTEVIEPGILRFHPKDARVWVKQKFAKRLKRYNIPLDIIFYHR